MANISLIRIDFRLIHGQVVTQWVKQAGADRIIIVNDTLSKDDFMGSVYKMAAPSGIKVDIYGIDDAIQEWNTDQFGKGTVLMLFKNVEDASTMQEKGFPISSLQIGGLGGGAGRMNTSTGVTFDAKDVQLLKEMRAKGSEIYIHVVPSQSKYDIDSVIDKLNL